MTIEARDFVDLAAYRQHYWPPDGIGGYEESSKVEDPRFTSFDSGTGAPHADDDLRLDPTIDTTDPAELPANLRSMYVAATGTDPADRGCYPSTGTPLRVGVDGRRVFRPHDLAVSETREDALHVKPVSFDRRARPAMRRRRGIPGHVDDANVTHSHVAERHPGQSGERE